MHSRNQDQYSIFISSINLLWLFEGKEGNGIELKLNVLCVVRLGYNNAVM